MQFLITLEFNRILKHPEIGGKVRNTVVIRVTIIYSQSAADIDYLRKNLVGNEPGIDLIDPVTETFKNIQVVDLRTDMKMQSFQAEVLQFYKLI